MKDRHIWPTVLAVAATMCVAAVALVANAGTVELVKGTWQTAISAGAINATNYTGWKLVNRDRTAVFEIDYTNSAATDVTMKCWTAEDATTANGSGFYIPILESSATSGTSDSYQHTWSNAVSGDEDWSWSVANLPHSYINCSFDGTSADADDKVTVKWRGIRP